MGRISYLDAFEVARVTAAKHNPSITKYKHAAVLVSRKGQIIAVGRNYFDGKKVKTDEGVLSRTVHAEINALNKINIRRLDGSVLISFGRTNASIILARPCQNCFAVLKKLGIRKMFYTLSSILNEPIWKEEKIT